MIQWLLRPGEEQDQLPLKALLAGNDMDADRPPGEFTVAEIDGQVVGALRLEWEGQAAFVRPIVVDAAWHGRDIGRALIRSVSSYLPVIYAVARGDANGFYRKLGFTSLPWDKTPERYRLECESCRNYDECQPELMILSRLPEAQNLKRNKFVLFEQINK